MQKSSIELIESAELCDDYLVVTKRDTFHSHVALRMQSNFNVGEASFNVILIVSGFIFSYMRKSWFT